MVPSRDYTRRSGHFGQAVVVCKTTRQIPATYNMHFIIRKIQATEKAFRICLVSCLFIRKYFS